MNRYKKQTFAVSEVYRFLESGIHGAGEFLKSSAPSCRGRRKGDPRTGPSSVFPESKWQGHPCFRTKACTNCDSRCNGIGICFPKKYDVRNAFYIGRQNPFNPALEYFDEVQEKWYGTSRFSRFLIDYAGASDADYVRAAGPMPFVAAVCRVREPGAKYDEMLVCETSYLLTARASIFDGKFGSAVASQGRLRARSAKLGRKRTVLNKARAKMGRAYPALKES